MPLDAADIQQAGADIPELSRPREAKMSILCGYYDVSCCVIGLSGIVRLPAASLDLAN
jgi:hypothetical protein